MIISLKVKPENRYLIIYCLFPTSPASGMASSKVALNLDKGQGKLISVDRSKCIRELMSILNDPLNQEC